MHASVAHKRIESGGEQFLRLRQHRVVQQVGQGFAPLGRQGTASLFVQCRACLDMQLFEKTTKVPKVALQLKLRCVGPIKPVGFIKRLNKQRCEAQLFQECTNRVLILVHLKIHAGQKGALQPKKSSTPRALTDKRLPLFNMNNEEALVQAHPEGEVQIAGNRPTETVTSLDTFAGKIHVKWAPEATVSSLGLMPFLIEFLKTSGLFDKWVEDCPLHYTSGNAPREAGCAGNAGAIGARWSLAIRSYQRDSGRRRQSGVAGNGQGGERRFGAAGHEGMDEAASGQWLKEHLKASYEPLLQEPWVLDVDTTVKPLYGHQQDAQVGYNPSKPGRPSHAYHSYFAANIRMVLDMEVQAGNQTAPLYAQPELWAFLDGLPEQNRPVFLRGDSHWGAEKAMMGAEERKLGYLFKLKQSANVKKLIGQIFRKEDWVEAGQQWHGREDVLRLSGWSRGRRVVVLRRPLRSKPAAEAEAVGKKKSKRKAAKQLSLDLLEVTYLGMQYEYAVLVTSLTDEVRTVAQHYRDRGMRRITSTS